MREPAPHRPPPSRSWRIVSGAFGVVLIVIAVVVLVSASTSTLLGSVVAAVVLAALGIDACVSAWRARPSLLERIGPLP